jgi:hypothetical protein
MTAIEASENVAAKRVAAISSMISNLRSSEDRQFYVGLVGYYIESIPYSATGLSMDLNSTQDICQTDIGFRCKTMFPSNMLHPGTVEANGIIKTNIGGQIRDLVRVKLEVMFDDVWSVAEFIDGKQHDLFLDSDTLSSGLIGFSSERN